MSRKFTRAELAERNTSQNAAIIIDNVVYDVTPFLEIHPGGPDVLLDNAGKDASRCFREVGHSRDAKLWRTEFKIGELVDEDRWEVEPEQEAEDAPETGLSLRGAMVALGPPLALAALAMLLHIYVV